MRNTRFANNLFFTNSSRRLLQEQATAYDEALYEYVARLLQGKHGVRWPTRFAYCAAKGH